MTDHGKAAMRAGTLRLTCLASMTGLHAVVIPAALVENLPVGLCLVGRRDTDRTLVALARQAATP